MNVNLFIISEAFQKMKFKKNNLSVKWFWRVSTNVDKFLSFSRFKSSVKFGSKVFKLEELKVVEIQKVYFKIKSKVP
jgi:hypothetical protein